MPTNYEEFLESKRIRVEDSGFHVEPEEINSKLFPFQREIARLALRRGRSAIFADCGLGKTAMQLEWAHHVAERTEKPILILAPLAVSAQTKLEGEKFGISVKICKVQADIDSIGINITNYEKLHHFYPDDFSGIVLDESSILKAFDGKTKKQLQEFARDIPYRLCATATPAPNDLTELCNHAEFLSVMMEKEIKALFFTQDGNTATKWRLKGHATDAFWRWMASWAVACRMPADIGFENDGFVLPPLKIHQVTLKTDKCMDGFLIPLEAQTLQERRGARRMSLEERVKATADLVNKSKDYWMIWTDLNAESEAITKAIYGAVEVTGSDSIEHKEKSILDFALGKTRVLVSKSTICGFGLNLQVCSNVAFVGLSDSYEQFYQAIRRCWRFGQKREVNAYVVTSSAEGAVVANIQRKEIQSTEMINSIVKEMAKNLDLTGACKVEEMPYREDVAQGDGWTAYLGDSVKQLDKIESDSVGLSVFSPPFPGMYTYTNSPHDIGNTRDIDEMIEHFKFIVAKDKLLRVLMPGRSCCVHLTQATAKKGVDGHIGLKDFRGKVIALMEQAGWIYYGEVCIDKDPQIKAIRTKDQGLLFKTLAHDSSKMHMALADYILQFRKPGDNPVPIPSGLSKRYNNTTGWITDEEWIEWAAPVWYRASEHYPGGIRETDVLNVSQARETNDERHLCPLQLGVIERCVKLWSAPGDTVLSPFMGIGSEGYEAIQLRRKFIGIELKESYFKQSCRNLRAAQHLRDNDVDILEAFRPKVEKSETTVP